MLVNGALSLHIVGRVGHEVEVEGGYLLNEVSWVVKPGYSGRFDERSDDRIENSC
jgi:hypothetical protein